MDNRNRRTFRFWARLVFVPCLLSPTMAAAQAPEVLRDPTSGSVIGLKPAVSSNQQSLVQGSAGLNTSDAKSISDSFIAEYKDLVGLANPAAQLTVSAAEADGIGINHIRYHQTHLGLDILGAEVIVHVDRTGQVTLATTKVAQHLPASAKPKIPAWAAGQAALQAATEDREVTWGDDSVRVSSDVSEPSRLQAARPTADKVPAKFTLSAVSSKLLIVPLDIILNRSTPDSRLAWEVKVNDTAQNGGTFSKNYYVDAASGAILLVTSNIQGLDRQIWDCKTPNGCDLDNYGRTEGSVPRGPSTQPGVSGPLDVDNTYSKLGAMHDLTFTSFGLNGANDQGGTGITPSTPSALTPAFAHYNNNDGSVGAQCPGTVGAFHAGTGKMYFCDGRAVNDVVGHEYGHALVFHASAANGNPGGPIYFGQTGALNEAFADVMGEALEYSLTGSADWKMGTGSVGGTFRNVINPWLTFNPRNFFSSDMGCGAGDNGGVHKNSTVISHAFYRMVVGGDEIGCTCSPIGFEQATKIFYRSWRHYLSSSASFAEAFTGIQAACSDLYPAAVCDQVRIALQAARIDQAGICSGAPDNGPSCTVAPKAVTYGNATRPTYFFDAEWSPQTMFAVNETLRARGWENLPNKQVKLFLRGDIPQDSAGALLPLPNYWDISSSSYTATFTGTTTTGPNGELDFTYPTLLRRSNDNRTYYQLYIDGNSDGFYEPWEDMFVPIQIRTVANGDGICYHGALYSTSETCVTAPADCACPAGYSCEDMSGGMPPGPFHTCLPTTGVTDPVNPTVFALGQNFPNPFNPQTLIVYDIPVSVTSVSLDIYDVAGRHVRNLVRGPVAPGRLNARWNGEDDRGKPVGSGVYYYRLDAGSFRATKMMLLFR